MASCNYCGSELVFTRTIRRGGKVIPHPAGKRFVFCSNKRCPRK